MMWKPRAWATGAIPQRCDGTIEPQPCEQCTPGTGTCNGNVGHWCEDDGLGYKDEICDPLQGTTCNGITGKCDGVCGLSSLGKSYIGCDYWPTVTANIVMTNFHFAVAVSNTTAQTATVTVKQVQGSDDDTPSAFRMPLSIAFHLGRGRVETLRTELRDREHAFEMKLAARPRFVNFDPGMGILKTLDFTPPFARHTYDELFARHTGVAADDEAAIRKLAEEIGFDTAGIHPDVVKNEVFEERVEDQLTGPVFVLDYPASICPLTKRKRGNAEIAERFELFIAGMEVANAYTELNDPITQEQTFRTQLAGLPEEDSMARMDDDFIRALKYAMPPAGGLGVGIDLLAMLLTDSQSIRDVILFPLLRPERKAQ